MCGIVGAIGANLDKELLYSLFLETEERGSDATGFWFPNTGIVKAPKKASVFLKEESETFKRGVENSRVFLGHTRYATHGIPKNNFNNHPLESENWIMVHNGVVSSMKDIKEYRYASDTDTENILAYIEHFGLEEGLSYCHTGAAILFVNKAEEDTLYLWKTYSNPIVLVYDTENEALYAISEEKFLWKTLEQEIETKKLLGGLFSIETINREMEITKTESRDLWKIQIKEDKLNAELLAKVVSKYTTTHNNTQFNHRSDYYNYMDYRYNRLQYTNYQEEEADTIFCNNRESPHRPMVIQREKEQKQKKKEEKFNKQSIIKTKQDKQINSYLYPDDVVRLKRPLFATDAIQSAQGNVTNLSVNDTFILRKHLQHDRVVVNDTDGVMYVMPVGLLELVPPPTCVGIMYNPNTNKCEECDYHLICAGAYYSYIGVPLPECIGGFSQEDDECTTCEYITPCLTKVEEKDTDYINAEFSEANENIIVTGEAIF